MKIPVLTKEDVENIYKSICLSCPNTNPKLCEKCMIHFYVEKLISFFMYHIDKLRRYTQTLEEKVEELTFQLVAKNVEEFFNNHT